MIEVAMIIEIRYGLELRLLEMNASLFFGFLRRRLWLEIHECVILLVDFNWLSNLWLVFAAAESALNADEVTCLQWRVAPQTWHYE
jgi:hypothetical protein